MYDFGQREESGKIELRCKKVSSDASDGVFERFSKFFWSEPYDKGGTNGPFDQDAPRGAGAAGSGTPGEGDAPMACAPAAPLGRFYRTFSGVCSGKTLATLFHRLEVKNGPESIGTCKLATLS
jgi:hypothetical protein